MTHPLFRSEMFVETAFEKRFQAMLRSAWHRRSWHVIVADPGSGKTMGIRDLVKAAGSRTILAVVTRDATMKTSRLWATASLRLLDYRCAAIGAPANPNSWDTCINMERSASWWMMPMISLWNTSCSSRKR